MFLAFWLVALTKSYPEQTILEILQQTTGKWVGNLFCWLYGLIIGVLSFLNLMQFSMMVKLYLLQVSPIYFPALLTIVTSAIVASKGIEPLARSAVICIPILVAIAAGVVAVGGGGLSGLTSRPYLNVT